MTNFVRLAGHLLKKAAQEFGNHGCNDFSLDPYLTYAEQIHFVVRAHELNGDPEEIPHSIERLPFVPDFVVMGTMGMILEPFTCGMEPIE